MITKFKVWNIHQKKWVTEHIVLRHDGTLAGIEENGHYGPDEYTVEIDQDNFIVCHYTQTKDREGIEIYAKDIVKYDMVSERGEFPARRDIVELVDWSAGNWNINSNPYVANLIIIGNILEQGGE